MMRLSHRWICCVAGILLLLSACAAVTVEVVPVALLSATPPPAVPHMTMATFTPVPVAGDGVESALVAAPVEAETPAPVTASVDVLPFTYHTVVPGDTILGLALNYGVPIAVIQLQNDLGNSIMLRAGQVLEIPPAVGWERDLPPHQRGARRLRPDAVGVECDPGARRATARRRLLRAWLVWSHRLGWLDDEGAHHSPGIRSGALV